MSKHSPDKKSALDRVCEDTVRLGYWGSAARMRCYVNYLFDGVPLDGRSFLDVGGGVGIFCAAARALGAARALCLEPGGAGANDGIKSVAGQGNAPEVYGKMVEFHTTTVEAYIGGNERDTRGFDVILLHNVINHLDESACTSLHRNQSAREVYSEKIRSLTQLAAPGGVLILCDCARSNFYPAVGLTNPLMRTIEWDKHQNPSLWRELFAQSEWTHVQTSWTTPNMWGRPGRLLGNCVCSYFLLGHFRMVLKRN